MNDSVRYYFHEIIAVPIQSFAITLTFCFLSIEWKASDKKTTGLDDQNEVEGIDIHSKVICGS